MYENHFEWFLTDRFGKIYNFDKSKIILGRKDCDIHLKSNSVDYKHCILSINEKDKSLKIKDLETANGTFINDKQIKSNNFKALNVGDKIRLAYDQITFTVQKKSVPVGCTISTNVTNSPNRCNEIPSVVTDPERFMPPLLCEMTDSSIDLNSSVEFKEDLPSESIKVEFKNSNQIENKCSKFPVDEEKSKSSKINYKTSLKSDHKEASCTNASAYQVQSKPAESFTIDFTTNDVNETESLNAFGLSKFVPSKLRSSFEEREKIKRTKLLSSNSFNKSDSLSNKSSDFVRSKSDRKNFSSKLTKIPNASKVKSGTKSNELLAKTKTVTILKKHSEKNDKVKIENVSKSITKPTSTVSISKDKKPVKNVSNNCKSDTPTFSRRNSKSYLLEKMLRGNEANSEFSNFVEYNNYISGSIPYNEPSSNLTNNNLEPVSDKETTGEKINQDTVDTVSETGTYVIETENNDKTADTEDTIEKDDVSTISSTHFNTYELESKSSTKWLSEFPTDDCSMDIESKSKRNPNAKFTGCSMPHIPANLPSEAEKNKPLRDDENSKANMVCLANDLRMRNQRMLSYNSSDPNNNLHIEETNNWKICESDSNPKIGNIINDFPSHQQTTHSPYVMGNQSLLVAEDVYVSDVVSNSTVPTNIYSRISNLPQKSKEIDLFSNLNFNSTQPNSNYHPRPTYSVASLDTALLLQDTEALLNDMEKRVYSRREIKTSEEFSKPQSFSTSFSQSEKIPYVDDGEEKEEDTSLFNYSAEVEESSRMSTLKQQTALSSHSDSINLEDKNRSYTVKSPITSGIIRRNNSCKVGVSESIVTQANIVGRKLNSSIRNQRSCSLIEERKPNNNNNNNNNSESFTDYRNKPKLSILATNPGTFINRRGSGGYSSALNSPIAKFEPISAFNSSFSNSKSKEIIPYLSTNMLYSHRQKFNRYEYGQHSLKYNSNSTTMLYNKYNNTSPPWNGDDSNVLNHNSVYPSYDTDYYSYNTMPEPFEASMLFLKHEPNIIENMQHQGINDPNAESEYQRREDIVEYNQPGNISGRSSAFSPVNSLHQSTESVNNFQITNKSRSSMGLNEQRICNYDFLIVSSIHLFSARLCRYADEIVHRLRREDPEYKASSPIESINDQPDTYGQIKSANRELQETLNNMRSLEKQLQKIEKVVFPPEKSGRNSTLGSCNEDSYLNQLERINKELEDFVPIDNNKIPINRNVPATKPTVRQDFSYLTNSESKQVMNQVTIPKSQQSIEKNKSKARNDMKIEQAKGSFSSSEICSPSKSKYSSLSKRFQHRKE